MYRSLSRLFRFANGCMRNGVLFLMFPSGAVVAQASVFAPADFDVDNRLAEIVILPGDMPGGRKSVLVLCQGFVESDGELTDYYCLIDELRGNPVHRTVLRSVINALGMQKFVAAKVDGENVRVFMNFAVAIDCSKVSCLTIPIRNHGYYFKEYGSDYVSPQPILVSDSWYEGFDDKLDWIQDWMASYRRVIQTRSPEFFPYTISVEVNADGDAHEGLVDWIDPGTQAIGRLNTRRAAASMGSPRFIPGFHEDQPVAMRLYERSVTRPN